MRVADPDGGRDLVLGERAAARLYPDATVLDALDRRRHAPPAGATSARSTFLEPVVGKEAWRVVAADYVTDDDGSGIVHIAPAFGEDDAQVGRAENLPVLNPVDADATFDHRVPPWNGRFVKDADPEIIADLRSPGPARGRAALRAQLPPLLAVRHAAHLLGQDVVVRPHRGAARRPARAERDDRLVPRPHQARPVRRAGSRATSTGRCRATATGARRCRSGGATAAGATRASGRSPSCPSWPGATCPTSTCTGPSSTR